ncbi:hypothetical protein BGW39_008686 [Mortierella sp. 14UC]|nr:hypothetical protein BGW39_008686 [Mortierella sp. 14UC]
MPPVPSFTVTRDTRDLFHCGHSIPPAMATPHSTESTPMRPRAELDHQSVGPGQSWTWNQKARQSRMSRWRDQEQYHEQEPIQHRHHQQQWFQQQQQYQAYEQQQQLWLQQQHQQMANEQQQQHNEWAELQWHQWHWNRQRYGPKAAQTFNQEYTTSASATNNAGTTTTATTTTSARWQPQEQQPLLLFGCGASWPRENYERHTSTTTATSSNSGANANNISVSSTQTQSWYEHPQDNIWQQQQPHRSQQQQLILDNQPNTAAAIAAPSAEFDTEPSPRSDGGPCLLLLEPWAPADEGDEEYDRDCDDLYDHDHKDRYDQDSWNNGSLREPTSNSSSSSLGQSTTFPSYFTDFVAFARQQAQEEQQRRRREYETQGLVFSDDEEEDEGDGGQPGATVSVEQDQDGENEEVQSSVITLGEDEDGNARKIVNRDMSSNGDVRADNSNDGSNGTKRVRKEAEDPEDPDVPCSTLWPKRRKTSICARAKADDEDKKVKAKEHNQDGEVLSDLKSTGIDDISTTKTLFTTTSITAVDLTAGSMYCIRQGQTWKELRAVDYEYNWVSLGYKLEVIKRVVNTQTKPRKEAEKEMEDETEGRDDRGGDEDEDVDEDEGMEGEDMEDKEREHGRLTSSKLAAFGSAVAGFVVGFTATLSAFA